jgi:hypothetical protein
LSDTLSDNVSPIGIPYGEAMRIVNDAYEEGQEITVSLRNAELHFFSKKNGTKCMTYHSTYMNFAIYDYVLTWVGPRKGRNKTNAILIKPKNIRNNQSITIFVKRNRTENDE